MADRDRVAACGDRGGDAACRTHRPALWTAARRFFVQRKECFVLFPAGNVDSDQHRFVGSSLRLFAISAVVFVQADLCRRVGVCRASNGWNYFRILLAGDESRLDINECKSVGREVKVEIARSEMRLLRRGEGRLAIQLLHLGRRGIKRLTHRRIFFQDVSMVRVNTLNGDASVIGNVPKGQVQGFVRSLPAGIDEIPCRDNERVLGSFGDDDIF